jgi:hypothetical protein
VSCAPTRALRAVALREHYPDGLRDTLSCGHVVYVTSLHEVTRRRCILCLKTTAKVRR